MEEDGVLKYRFYYYLSMAGPPDQETTAIEKIGCHSVPKKTRCTKPRRAMWGSTRLGQVAEEQEEGMGVSLYCGFPGKKWVRHDKQI